MNILKRPRSDDEDDALLQFTKRKRTRIIPLMFSKQVNSKITDADLRKFVDYARKWIKQQKLSKLSEIKIVKKNFVTFIITAVESIDLNGMTTLRNMFNDVRNLFDICYVVDNASIEISFCQREETRGILKLESVEDTKWDLSPAQHSIFAQQLPGLEKIIAGLTSMVFMENCTWVIEIDKNDAGQFFHLTMKFPARQTGDPLRKISIALLCDFNCRVSQIHPDARLSIDRTYRFGRVHIVFQVDK